MWSKVESYINTHKLLDINKLYLVALSGGADSVALLLLLKEHGYNIHAAHCNFHLRGEESDRDEKFCVALCEQMNIELHRVHFDTETYAELHKVSIEMAARELRYRWFEQLRQDIGAAGICVAHHRDDSVETVLLNLVRGTGIHGLVGILPRNGYIVRPLLCVSRAEIENFLHTRNQDYVTDSTNLESNVKRNRIRLEILPLLKTLNPSISDSIQQTAENIRGAVDVLDALLSPIQNNNTLNYSQLQEFGSSDYIVFEWLKNYGFNGSQVHQLLKSEVGSVFVSSKGFEVLKDRDGMIVEPVSTPMKPFIIPEEGTYILPGGAMKHAEKTSFSVRRCEAYISRDSSVATVDVQKVQFPLTLRRVTEGDRMQPYGMKGSKLLSNLMTDLKMNLFEKRSQLVVVDANGVIVWAVGLRIDQKVAVSEHTKEVFELRIYS